MPTGTWKGIAISGNGKFQMALSYENGIYASNSYGAENTWYNVPSQIQIDTNFVSIAMSSNGQYLTIVNNSDTIYYSVTPYINLSASNNLNIYGDTLLNQRLIVNNSSAINSSLFVLSDVSINSRLNVYSDVSFNNRLFVGGDVSLNSRLTVYDDVSFNNRLVVGGDVSLNSRLTV